MNISSIPSLLLSMVRTGLAFSGGGIRSAAFCSGVLRRLLQYDVEPDYLSCVSGGGYTGTAYLDWKYHNRQKDDPRWHKQFFNRMRKRAGMLCDWQNPLHGILDTMILIGLMLFVSYIAPFIIWVSYAFPVAMFVDFVSGDILRADRFRCPELQKNEQNATAVRDTAACVVQAGTLAYKRVYLFFLPLASSIFFYIWSRDSRKRISAPARFLSYISGLLFALTCGPWFINDFLDKTPVLVQSAAVLFSIFTWFVAPGLRDTASLILLVYTFAYVVYWRVYDATILGIKHSDGLFFTLLLVSGLVIFFTPFFDVLQGRLVHIYNRWRLQKAFYTDKGAGKNGCSGIGWYDYFPGSYCCTPRQNDPEQLAQGPLNFRNETQPYISIEQPAEGPLCLSDLRHVKPQYISNTVVNDWRYYPQDKKYDLLTMSPEKIQRISKYQAQVNADEELPKYKRIPGQFSGQLEPADIKLSEAMATSAAALSSHMGASEESLEILHHLQAILGLGMGAVVISNLTSERKESQNKCIKVIPLVIQVVRVVPLVFLPFVYFAGAGDSDSMPIGVLVFFALHVLLSASAVVNTGVEKQGCLVKLARWLAIHVPFCRYIRELFDVTNTGPVPPAVLLLSDGGHIENLGILPLLKKKLDKIVVVDGGNGSFRNTLINALELARKKLNCSFTTMDGDNELADIKEKFRQRSVERPQKYEFKVQYYKQEGDDEDGRRSDGEGRIIVIGPRYPSTGQSECNWRSVSPRDAEVPDPDLWGDGPILASSGADRLTFCCCECCHDSCSQCCHGKCMSAWGWISKKLCGVFPHHKTMNQFFTPAMFSAYHREGYRACMEANIVSFFKGTNENMCTEEV